jgi:WD40 repeat protein
MATLDAKGRVRLWAANTGESLLDFRTSGESVHALTFSPSNRYLVAGGAKLWIWDSTGE